MTEIGIVERLRERAELIMRVRCFNAEEREIKNHCLKDTPAELTALADLVEGVVWHQEIASTLKWLIGSERNNFSVSWFSATQCIHELFEHNWGRIKDALSRLVSDD